MKYNTVLFDMDGTLMDSNELICDSWHYTMGTLTDRTITEEEIRGTLGEPLVDSMLRLLPDVDVELALETYRVYQRGIYLDRIKLFPGTEEFLHAVKKTGSAMAIVTSRMRSSTERGLNHVGITDFFDLILTVEDTPVGKPDPAPLYLALDKLGRAPEDAIFIGDTTHDVEAGLAAGVFTLLVDWSFALPPETRKDGVLPSGIRPNLIAYKWDDVLPLLT